MHAQRNAQRNVPYVVLFLVHHRQVYSEEGLDLDAGLQQGAGTELLRYFCRGKKKLILHLLLLSLVAPPGLLAAHLPCASCPILLAPCTHTCSA